LFLFLVVEWSFSMTVNGQVYEQWWDFPHLLLFLLRL
jgi:hypothetical protein